MNETLQPTRITTTTGGGGLDSIFDDSMFNAGTITVQHGVLSERSPANQSVGEVRRRLRDRLGLDPDSPAFVDGREVDDNTRLRAGQRLMFGRKSGEKGLGVTL